MPQPLKKDDSILCLLELLGTRLGSGAFDVVDHWEADACAVGVASPRDHGVLAYLSTFGLPAGRYYLELECPPRSGDEAPYEVAGRFTALEFEELVDIVARHLLAR